MATMTFDMPKTSAASNASTAGGCVNVSPERLLDFGTKVYVAAGMPEADARFYPGEPEARADKKNREKGLMLPKDAITALTKLADEMGLASDLPF